MLLLKNSNGSVKPYTRHIHNCPYLDQPGYNACRCPKWVYIHKRGEPPQRKTLSTPSWAEAQTIAADALKALDPEIAESRAAKKVKKTSLLTFDAAIKLWETRPNGGRVKYPWLTSSLKVWAEAKGMMHIQDVTTLALTKWYASKMWSDYKATTRAQHWGVLRSFFAYLTMCRAISENPILPIKATKISRDLVQGPYTDEQVDAIVASVANETAKHTWADEGDRVQLFLSLLLNTGCDVVDAVLHQPTRIKNTRVGDVSIPVYRYKRRKTGVDGVIPLDDDVAHKLRAIPLVDGYSVGLPFRDRNPNLRMTCELWERRIKYCIRAAGVKEVVLPGLDDAGRPRTSPANVKQFRHTFAVRQLIAGQRPEDVARMLGHSTTEMIRRHYAPWIEAMDSAYLMQVMKHR